MAAHRGFKLTLLICVLLCLMPAAMQAQQWVPLGPDGGDVRSLAYDPQDPDRLFLGTSAGQLYVSTNGGGSWTRYARLGSGNDYVLDNIEIDPTNSKIMYIAAWSVDGQTNGGDLFRSKDGGKTWQPLTAMHGKSIRALAVSASDNRIIVAGALDGVFRSRDGGDKWEQISPPNHAEIKNIESIAIDPRDPNIVYAGTWHLAWKTNDGGKNWHSIKNGVVDDSDVFSIIVDKKNSSVVYLSACSGIYKSESAAELFRKIQGIPFSARRTRVLQQDPSDMNVVYAGTTEGLWKTVDAGKTWKRMTGPNIIVNDVMVDPRNSSKVLLATDRSGVLASKDGAQTFTASNRGFAHRQVSALVVDRDDPETMYVGLVNDKEFGGVFASHDGGNDWRQITDGLAGKDIFTLTMAANGSLLAGTNHGMFEMVRHGNAWKPMNTVVSEKQVRVPPKTKKAKATYKTELVKAEFSGRVSQIEVGEHRWFAATSAGLMVSADEGKSWKVVEGTARQYFTTVRAVNGNVVAATQTSLMLSKDDGATWTPGRAPAWVSVVFGATVTPDAIWLATREGGVRSTDGGQNWEHVLGGLPTRNLSTISYDDASHMVRATASNGELFESRDSGKSWRRVDSGWTMRSVASAPGKLLAITAFDGVVMLRSSEARQRESSKGGR